MAEKTMEKIVALAKNRGFVYPGSEIYGGLANTWDYGPIGVEPVSYTHLGIYRMQRGKCHFWGYYLCRTDSGDKSCF